MAVDTWRFLPNRQEKRRRRRRRIGCFQFIVALIALQAFVLLYVGFGHSLDHHYSVDNVSPLETFLGAFSESSYWFFYLNKHDEAGIEGGEQDENVVDESSNNTDSDDQDDDLMQLEDRIAEDVEGKLLMTPGDEQEEGSPLDNYYTRSHITEAVPLIVGGSDGSGTRAFVDVLSQLGVPMLVDDRGTMDLHCKTCNRRNGWPPFAIIALEEGHSSNYKIEDLSDGSKQTVKREIEALREHNENRYARLQRKMEGKSRKATSSSVSYGFKAPITMLLMPMMRAFYNDGTAPSKLKFLHVVRDGRDVALSSNQSPVQKFYKSTYPDSAERLERFRDLSPVLGMQLWNDWNADLSDWEESQQDVNFDYLIMRTEDLLNPETKFESLTQLADFVGSSLSREELCCQSRKALVDMGESGVGRGRGGRRHQQFGSDHIQEYYEKRREWMDRLAKSVGKDSVEEMTARERIQAMAEMRKSKGKLMGGDGPGKEYFQERNKRFQLISNRVAQRLSGRNAALSTERQKDHREELLRRHNAGHMRNHNLQSMRLRDNDLIVRRRRLLSWWSSYQSDPREQQLDRSMAMKLRMREERLRNRPTDDAAMNGELRGGPFRRVHGGHGPQHLRRPRGGFGQGDEELGKHIKSQVADLKSKATAADTKKVSDRYGKWAGLLSSAPDLSKALHEEGKRALELFGYEPRKRFMDYPDNNFVCDETVVCPEDDEQPKAKS